tara:strand:- start:22 stop:960 length:939 start_codon:yes stop_codon:yes gene_type:complete
MDLAEKLRQESYSEHVAYTEFILKLKNNTQGLFCFFEGKEDNKYYGIRIKNITQREYKGIVCGNKDNLIKLEKLISTKEEYTDIDKLYFIDKDFSVNCSFDNIYCLPSYSIENEYSKIEVLRNILINEFSLDTEHPDFQKVIDYFNKTREEFHANTLLLNSWLSCQNQIREETENSTRLNIDQKVGDYFKNPVNTDLNTISDFSDLDTKEKIEAIFNEAPKVDSEVLNNEIAKFEQSDCYSTFRGKFELRFFISFLSRLQGEICKKEPELFDEKHKCSLKFEYPSALTSLSIYALTPECLIEYLNTQRKNVA